MYSKTFRPGIFSLFLIVSSVDLYIFLAKNQKSRPWAVCSVFLIVQGGVYAWMTIVVNWLLWFVLFLFLRCPKGLQRFRKVREAGRKNSTSWCQVMTKRPKKFTNTKATTPLMWAYPPCNWLWLANGSLFFVFCPLFFIPLELYTVFFRASKIVHCTFYLVNHLANNLTKKS